MIALDKLQSLANKKQTTEQNIRREYIQHLFLSYFYQQPQTATIFFKGGTALRLVYNSPRFSEDLDFSTSSGEIKPTEDAIQDALREIEREGIGTELIEAKETSGGYLAVIHFKLPTGVVAVQLEISFRDREARGEVVTIGDNNDFVPPYTLMVLRREQLVNQKIQALLTRQKPRDFYDLYFILRANLLPAAEKSVLPQVLEKLAKANIPFSQELERFLPKSHWPIVKDFRLTLEREIEKFI